MTQVQRYLPVALSGACVIVAAYFTLTDTAYQLMGCPSDTYPEAGFLLIVDPVAATALTLSIMSMNGQNRPRLQRASIIGSVVLSTLSVILTLWLVWPTGSSCS